MEFLGQDIMTLIVLFGGGGIFAFSLGRSRLMLTMLSSYVALAVLLLLPDSVQSLSSYVVTNQSFALLISFITLFIVTFIVLGRSRVVETFDEDLPGGLLGQILFSTILVGFLIAVVLLLYPGASANVQGPTANLLFGSDSARAIWSVLPITAVAVESILDR